MFANIGKITQICKKDMLIALKYMQKVSDTCSNFSNLFVSCNMDNLMTTRKCINQSFLK